MDINPNHTLATTSDLEHSPYVPLPESPTVATSRAKLGRPISVFFTTFASAVVLLLLVALIMNQSQDPLPTSNKDQTSPSAPLQPTKSFSGPEKLRGVDEGVSAKSNPSHFFKELSYNWTNAMLSWQRTAYHFQPEKDWMNDPDGPLFHMGWYHLFYQYNPDSATWGNITWGHTVSRDLIHWYYLPLALVPDHWYDINGVWTGSATLLPDGQIIMLYTGDTNASVQVQNLAYPANVSDPLLLDWVKYSGNPVMVPPTGIETDEFRDPSTAWMGPNNTWYLTIGSRHNESGSEAGIAMVYKTKNFTSYEKLEGLLHQVPDTGMWECIDFYPVSTNESIGLNTSALGPGVKHILKASLDDTKKDHYAIGTYDEVTNTWTPDNPAQDVGIGLRYDYGWWYASKTFYDQNKKRRILWGWINETDTETDDLKKGWASLQAIPRSVLFDNKTRSNLLQWPVDEIESLRLNSTDFEDVLIEPGSIIPLDIGSATQLDIFVEFEIEVISNTTTEDYECSGGARDRSNLGPFGLLVIADDSLSELTPVFFRPVNSTDGNLTTYFCSDETRSSLANDVLKVVYGTSVPVLDDENYFMRVLVDHSIVESFAQGGRRVITSRIYPTEAIYGNARLFLFNNATGVNVTATIKVWELNSAFIGPYPLGQD